ncbi:MAG: ATP-binding protein [Kofleriaceae bacterium]
MSTTRIAMSRTGRWVALSRETAVEVVDLLGTTVNRAWPVVGQVAFVGRELWALVGSMVHRVAPEDLRPLAPAQLMIPGEPRGLVAGYGAHAVDAAVTGEPVHRVTLRGEVWSVQPLEGCADQDAVVAVYGQRTVIARRDTLRVLDRGRELWRTKLGAGDVIGGCVLFGGRALVVLVRGEAGDHCRVLQATGALIHQIGLPQIARWAVAEELGQAFVLGSDGKLSRVDLRYGRVVDTIDPPLAVADLAVDQDGRHLVFVGDGARVVHVVVSELFRGGVKLPAPEAPIEEAVTDPIVHSLEDPRVHEEPVDAAQGEAPPIEPIAPTPALEVPDTLPLALGPAPAPAPQLEPDESPYASELPGEPVPLGYTSAREHLDALLDVVASRTALAIAEGWNTGRLSQRDQTTRPHELEVAALIGGVGGFAADQLGATKQQVANRQRDAATRAKASAARGIRLPFQELSRELGLSATAAQVLLLAAAPALRGEITRLYGVLSNDPHRPIVDRFLIEQIAAGDASAVRDQIARELAPDAPLVRHGLLQIDSTAATSLFSRLSVPDALLDRLRGLRPPRADDVWTLRTSDRALESLQLATDVKHALVVTLGRARTIDAPLRLVMRGRRGSGRHALLAAIAARISRELAQIDVTRMPRTPKELAASLRAALFRAHLHGVVPVLSGLEQVNAEDGDARELVRHVLRVHPGPLVIRTSPESTLPIDPGFETVVIPALTETERAVAWTAVLGAAGMTADTDTLAARYRICPGVITRVVDHVAAHGVDGDATAALDAQVRQHVATRLDHVASRVIRLAGWEDVALPDEMLDSLREFIARARYRKTVFEQWGYDAKLSTSRGLTALFYGPPGTGKTMVAGVIARELGLDVYRVDLARTVSKWVGETEKNLGAVFDAAEDGQVLILFDEADSLFAKRTDVKTANDRYANLEVNYLLQRLDSFEGVAILTSNLDGAIDPAFKRRLSLRMQFPFPDEDMRLRLWAAHVTPQTPTVGDFDFGDLARRFPLSGGYIRNCVVRAAFLAAHEGRSLGQGHLLRAIQLEYRELGKLSTSSRME